jgi:hypothetical protein
VPSSFWQIDISEASLLKNTLLLTTNQARYPRLLFDVDYMRYSFVFVSSGNISPDALLTQPQWTFSPSTHLNLAVTQESEEYTKMHYDHL